MPSYWLKTKRIYLPFLAIACGFIACYTLFHWFLTLVFPVLPVQQEVLSFWLPFALPWVPLIYWLRGRLQLLKLSTNNGDLTWLYLCVAAMAIAVPAIIAQKYVEAATGQLTKVHNAGEIDAEKPAKYYTVEKFYLDKKQKTTYQTYRVSGKYNNDLYLIAYSVVPLYTSAADSTSPACAAWVGFTYEKRISNRLSDEEKRVEYLAFVEEEKDQFLRDSQNEFAYLHRVGNSDAGDGYRDAIKNHPAYAQSQAPVFVPVKEPFSVRLGTKLPWTFVSLAIGPGLFLVLVLIPGLRTGRRYTIQRVHAKNLRELNWYLAEIKPRKGFYVTPILVYVNVFIFLAMVFAGLGFFTFHTLKLMDWGANLGPVTRAWQYWRLFTNFFLHAGIQHLGANMVGLWIGGMVVEPILGTKRFLAFYLVCGFLASVASITWYQATISVGASGAIFGIYGVLLALLVLNDFPKHTHRGLLIGTAIFIGYSLFMGLFGGIDNAAHLGGLAAGFVGGLFFNPRVNAEARERVIF